MKSTKIAMHRHFSPHAYRQKQLCSPAFARGYSDNLETGTDDEHTERNQGSSELVIAVLAAEKPAKYK